MNNGIQFTNYGLSDATQTTYKNYTKYSVDAPESKITSNVTPILDVSRFLCFSLSLTHSNSAAFAEFTISLDITDYLLTEFQIVHIIFVFSFSLSQDEAQFLRYMFTLICHVQSEGRLR